MTAGDRFKRWIEGLADAWKDKLRGWLLRSLAEGASKFLEINEPEAVDLMTAQLSAIRDDPNTPQILRDVIDKLTAGKKPIPVAILIIIACFMLIPTITAIFQPLGNLWTQRQERVTKSFRLDSGQVLTAWRRDPAKYAGLFDDLKDQGINDPRIEVLKFITEIIPGVQDLIRMSVREAFSPEIAEKFGQYQDPPVAVYPWAEKLGLSKDWVDRYWAAHWELPSSGQGFEMLHRNIINEDELKLLLRALDVMPFWRDRLINISWAVPTRVDVRRFWDMRTIDEARLREIYTALGYHGKDLEDYILWTKIFVDFPDLLARYKNGWITLEQVKSELIAMGMKPERAATLIEEKIKKAAPERVAKEKDITKTDIIKGVKTNVITRAQGVELLEDIGYDRDEAVYLLEVNIPADEEEKAITERQLTKSDVLNGLKAEVISTSQARTKLLELRYKPADVDFLLKVYESSIKPPAEPKLKEASKADVLLGVKKGLITPEEGYRLLLDMDFTPEAASFILMVHAEESPFSPVNYEEFKDMTQKYRLATGMEGKPMTEEIKRLGAEVVRLSAELDALEKSIKEEQGKLVAVEGLPAQATAHLKELQAAKYQAEAELARVQLNYWAKIGEWRRGVK